MGNVQNMKPMQNCQKGEKHARSQKSSSGARSWKLVIFWVTNVFHRGSYGSPSTKKGQLLLEWCPYQYAKVSIWQLVIYSPPPSRIRPPKNNSEMTQIAYPSSATVVCKVAKSLVSTICPFLRLCNGNPNQVQCLGKFFLRKFCLNISLTIRKMSLLTE